MARWEDYLKSIYFDPFKPGSFQSAEKLYQVVKEDGRYNITRYQIQKWLQQEEAYSLQKSYRHKFRRTPIVVAGKDDQWSADLMDMVKFAKDNNDVKYVLVVVDSFSKYLWLRPLKDKTGPSVAAAFKDIFKEGRKPNRLRSDKGQEFRAKVVKDLMKSKDIRQLFAQNENKASISERAIKTIKAKMYRYFTYKNAYKYIDQLQSFADGYNKTIHRSIDMAPNDVTSDNEEEVHVATYLSRTTAESKKRYKYKIGDRVRITHLRNVFSREYDQKWTGEIFTVAQRFYRGNTPIYRLNDYDGEAITGSFYQPELQKVYLKDNELFKIERILRTRGRGQNKQYFVKWLYWPSKFNSWVKASDIEEI